MHSLLSLSLTSTLIKTWEILFRSILFRSKGTTSQQESCVVQLKSRLKRGRLPFLDEQAYLKCSLLSRRKNQVMQLNHGWKYKSRSLVTLSFDFYVLKAGYPVSFSRDSGSDEMVFLSSSHHFLYSRKEELEGCMTCHAFETNKKHTHREEDPSFSDTGSSHRQRKCTHDLGLFSLESSQFSKNQDSRMWL